MNEDKSQLGPADQSAGSIREFLIKKYGVWPPKPVYYPDDSSSEEEEEKDDRDWPSEVSSDSENEDDNKGEQLKELELGESKEVAPAKNETATDVAEDTQQVQEEAEAAEEEAGAEAAEEEVGAEAVEKPKHSYFLRPRTKSGK